MTDAVMDDAREYGLHIKSGGWRLGLLVARNVERRTPRHQKVAISAFAEMAGVSRARVKTHLDSWDRAAEAGHVPAATTLHPGEEIALDLDTLPKWDEFYVPVSGGYNGSKTRTPSKQAVSDMLDGLSAADRAKLAAELVSMTEVREAILQAGPLAIEQFLMLGGEIVESAEKNTERRMKEKFPSSAARTAADEIGTATRHLNNALAEVIHWRVTAGDDRLRLVQSAMTRAERAVNEINDALGVPA